MLLLLGTHSNSIYSVDFNPSSNQIKLLKETEITQHPSWLTAHPVHKDIIYSNGHVQGKVFCIKVNLNDGSLQVLDEAKTGGVGPTHLGLNSDNSGLLIAHYGQDDSGLLSMISLSPDGRFASKITTHHFKPTYKPSPSNHPRLDAPHVHHVITSPDGDQVIICDLGSNDVWTLKQTLDGWKDVKALGGFQDGDGPRHSVVHPNGKTIYVLNEVSSTLTAHSLPSTGTSQVLARFSLLPPDDEDNEEMTAAEIILLPPLPGSPNGSSLLLATNRFSKSDKGDAIALFVVDNEGKVERAPKPFYHGIGKHIRALAADPSGRYIATAGRDGGGVVILERAGEEGLELKEVARLDIPLVVVPLWL